MDIRSVVVDLVRQVLLNLSFLVGTWVAQVSKVYDFITHIVDEVIRGYRNVIDCTT